MRRLWRGTLPSIIRTGFGSAVYFSTLNALRRAVSAPAAFAAPDTGAGPRRPHSSTLPRLSNGANLATGAGARVFAGFVLMPLTVLKVRYESSLYAYGSLGSAAAAVVRSGGVRGLFAGFGATAARDAPYAGLFVLFYERMKAGLSAAAAGSGESGGGGGGAPSATAINLASSVGAAGLATAITNPFDAIKTRVQLMPREYQNMAVACTRMLREEGVKSFLDGLGLRMARKAMSSALAWTIYEELIRKAEVRVAGRQMHVG